MHKNQVRDAGQALAYITDCTLATVCDLASKKSASKRELSRQISIAQTAIDWMTTMKVDFSATRAVDACAAGGVAQWAQKFLSGSA
jgi:hypothetical protein